MTEELQLVTPSHKRRKACAPPKSVVLVSRAMRRLLVLFLTLFSLLCQSVAVAGVDLVSPSPFDPVHQTLHWQAEGHHHHHDGSFHQDQSEESLQHASGDHVGSHFELPNSISHAVLPAGSILPSAWHDATVPNPFLDGLLRPPRLHA